jgi:hypothetical protein
MFGLFNVERFHAPLNIASFVYVLATVVAVLILGIKPLGKMRLPWLLLLPMAAFLVLKLVWGYPLIGPMALPITVTEICAIVVTAALAHQIACRLHGIESASAAIIAEDPSRQPVPLETAQSAMYREVRRARQHDRPLALLSVASHGQCASPVQDHLLKELQRELMDKFTNFRIADLLAKETKDHAIVTQTNQHFVVLLPETDRTAAEEVVQHLNATVKSTLGLKLRIGMSTFPDEEVTLVGLLKRAETAMRERTNGERRPVVLEPMTPSTQSVAYSEPIHSDADSSEDHSIIEFQRGLGDPTNADRRVAEAVGAPSPRSMRSPK